MQPTRDNKNVPHGLWNRKSLPPLD